MPGAHGLTCLAISDENRVDDRAEIPLDYCSGIGIGADEVAQWADDCAFAELASLVEQAGSGWCETDPLALERLQRVHLSLERRVGLLRAKKRGARRRVLFAPSAQRAEGCSESSVRGRSSLAACGESFFGITHLATNRTFGISELRFLFQQCRTPRLQLLQLALCRLPVECVPMCPLAHLARTFVRGLDGRPRRGESCANTFFLGDLCRERALGERHLCLELGAVGDGVVEIVADLFHRRVAFAPLLLCPLSPGDGVALSLFGYRDFSAQLLRTRRLLGNQPRELVSPGFSGCTRTMRRVARSFGSGHCFFRGGNLRPQLAHAPLEAGELVTPGVHLPRCKGDLDSEAATHDLGVPLRAPALSRQ